jgi:Domain of unknown function (DUF6378)
MGAATTNRGRPLRRAPPANSAMTAEQLLEQAASVVLERRRTYGQPRELFEQIARRWSVVLGLEVTPAQAVQCMLEVKAARLAHDPRHLDSITDIAGYAGLLAELLDDA